MVGRIEMGPDGRATGVHYHREGRWRFQKARNVVVAGYAIETPRLLLASATDRYPDGLANSSGLVGKNLMTQSNQAVFGTMDEEVRGTKARLRSPSPNTGTMTTARISRAAIAGWRKGRCRWRWMTIRPAREGFGARRCATRWRNTIIRSD